MDPVRDRADDAHSALLTSRLGQAVVGVLVVVGGVWIVGPNTPAGPARDVLDVLWAPAVEIGVEQNWAVFSPNPRNQSLEVAAVLEYDDGTTAQWTLPDFDPVVGAYRSYRWGKWQERIRLDANQAYWESSAAWIAAENRREGELPTVVRLVRRWVDHDPLTSQGAADGPRNEFEFYVWTRPE